MKAGKSGVLFQKVKGFGGVWRQSIDKAVMTEGEGFPVRLDMYCRCQTQLVGIR